MKITAIGESRKVYPPHTIFDSELKIVRSPYKQTWRVNKDTGAITFSWYKWSLNMHGNYIFGAQLSREEIVRLFVSSMSDVPFDEVVRLLAESGKKRTAPLPTVAGAAAGAVASAA